MSSGYNFCLSLFKKLKIALEAEPQQIYSDFLVEIKGIFQRKVVYKSAKRIETSVFTSYSPTGNLFLCNLA